MTDPRALDPNHYYAELALAFVRGQRPDLVGAEGDVASSLSAAAAAGLRLHPFKRTALLARVARVLGILRGFAPDRLLDVGSGRGAFLWPLLEGWDARSSSEPGGPKLELGGWDARSSSEPGGAKPGLRVTAIDMLSHRVAQIAAVARGGVDRLTTARMDVTRLGFADLSFDVVTILEVLEHLDRPEAAAAEVVRVARRAVIATVPSRADDNPGHLRLYQRDSLTALLCDAGARRVDIDYLLGHMVAVAVK